MDTIFPAWPPSTLAVANQTARYQVRRIFCVGRNYAEHIREMGHEPNTAPPSYFTKFPESVVESGVSIEYPPGTSDFHYEVELVLAIGREGFDVPQTDAQNYIYGYAVGLDMTRRDLQLASRDKGLPWDTGKNFSQSAPISVIQPSSNVGHPREGKIWLEVDGKRKQDSDIGDMIWGPDQIIADLSKLYTLLPGDLIMTGTPAGVGPVVSGQMLRGHIDGLEDLIISIA